MVLCISECLLLEVLDREGACIIVLLAVVLVFIILDIGSLNNGLLHGGQQKVGCIEALLVNKGRGAR